MPEYKRTIDYSIVKERKKCSTEGGKVEKNLSGLFWQKKFKKQTTGKSDGQVDNRYTFF